VAHKDVAHSFRAQYIKPIAFDKKAPIIQVTMPSTPYHPKPIDTSHVDLKSVGNIVERLAENAHEIWAQQRLKDGWRLGPVRDDVRKLHPCLIPYSELPDSEKTYDREIVTQTIKALLALGYRIS